MAKKGKVRKSVSKRFRLSGSGKILRQRAAHNHRLIPKSKKSKGLAKIKQGVASGDAKHILSNLQL